MKLNFRIYLLGQKKRTILDKKHDVFYEQSRIEYIHRAFPFTFPVFVV